MQKTKTLVKFFGYLIIVLFLALLQCVEVVISSSEPFPSEFVGSLFSTFGRGEGGLKKMKTLVNFLVIDNRVFLTLLQCLEVIISSFEPFPSDFERGGGVFIFYIRRCYVENKDPGQNFGQVKIVLFLTLLLCLEVVISSFKLFPSDFERGLIFLSISLTIEDLVVSYTSMVEIPVSNYL